MPPALGASVQGRYARRPRALRDGALAVRCAQNLGSLPDVVRRQMASGTSETMWVKLAGVSGVQFAAVKDVDLDQSVDDFKAR